MYVLGEVLNMVPLRTYTPLGHLKNVPLCLLPGQLSSRPCYYLLSRSSRHVCDLDFTFLLSNFIRCPGAATFQGD